VVEQVRRKDKINLAIMLGVGSTVNIQCDWRQPIISNETYLDQVVAYQKSEEEKTVRNEVHGAIP
jgi:hypothetical protein